MKKYLFLIILFLIYIGLMIGNRDDTALTINEQYDENVLEVSVKNNNNINSLFQNYNNEYYIKQIELDGELIETSCSDIDTCLKDIYNQEGDTFITNYILNDYKVKKITFLAYKEEILPYLEENSIDYELN